MSTTRALLALVFLLTSSVTAWAKPQAGRFLHYAQVSAAGLPAQRLSIWLPPGYDKGKRRYPVLYMHDGHNLFDLAKSNFGKIWAADQAMLAAMRSGKVEPHIIVGIAAPEQDRFRQYLPKSAYDAASAAQRVTMDLMAGGPIISDAYLAWLAGPLKAWVDTAFRTRTGPRDTAIAGSSMGGLMSCWAFTARPDVYGRAACISTHWPLASPGAELAADPAKVALNRSWFSDLLGSPAGRRLWMDHGTATLDAVYPSYQAAIDADVAARGWQRGRDWQSQAFPGAAHEENAWAARLPDVFGWLLQKD